jgi:transcriptional regulator with XRE-family HTH domain
MFEWLDKGKLIPRAIAMAIRDRRIKLGITQKELAARSGLTRTFVCLLEKSPRDLSLLTFQRIAEALETNPSELMAEAELLLPSLSKAAAEEQAAKDLVPDAGV